MQLERDALEVETKIALNNLPFEFFLSKLNAELATLMVACASYKEDQINRPCFHNV